MDARVNPGMTKNGPVDIFKRVGSRRAQISSKALLAHPLVM
jgi:hypothetical protein